MEKNNISKIYKVASMIGIIVTIILCVIGYKAGVFKSTEALKEVIDKVGIFGPLLFILIQIIQVVIPIIPGGITLLAGVLIFGPVWGFIYNYIGIVVGSIIAFLMVRKLGKPFLQSAFSKQYDKYVSWIDKGKRFNKMFAVAILLPVAPDDFLCMFAGLTKMRFLELIAILIICKPPTILAYSLGLTTIAKWITLIVR